MRTSKIQAPRRAPPILDSLTILYEDEAVLAVAKPAGLHVFPSIRGERKSVWSLLKEMRSGTAGPGEPAAPSIVHRLDRGTSGVLLAAKTGPVHRALRESFETGRVEKVYLALVEGELDRVVEVDLPLGSRYRRSAKVQVQLPGRRLRGVRPAQTTAEPIGTADGLTLCRVRIRTGVRHQIRVHLSHLDHPVVGDREYGARREFAGLGERFFLHAWSIRIPHPVAGPPVHVVCPLPDELTGVLGDLGMQPGRP